MDKSLGETESITLRIMEQQIDGLGSRFIYLAHWLDKVAADELYQQLLSELPWQNENIKIFGRFIPVPRKVVWLADPGISYTYSGIQHTPKPWPQALLTLRQRLNQTYNIDFNSMLANFYAHGRDYMGWHSDDEKELGINPTIASISLGETRKFVLRHKQSKAKHTLWLQHGSLLLMLGPLQHHWQHTLPKTKKHCHPRINLTFRQISNG
jgi:alkylated DNA repair dioxygenase AlkB